MEGNYIYEITPENKPLTAIQFETWDRLLPWQDYDETCPLQEILRGVPDPIRTIVLTAMLDKRFNAFQVQREGRDRGEQALFGKSSEKHWTLLARWSDKQLTSDVTAAVRQNLCRELGNPRATFWFPCLLIAVGVILGIFGSISGNEAANAVAIVVGIVGTIYFIQMASERSGDRKFLDRITTTPHGLIK